MGADLLNPDTAAVYLAQRGVITDPSGAVVVVLGGGVSNVVLAVRTPDSSVVVKQALPQLRVGERWLASPDRIITEAVALELAATGYCFDASGGRATY